MGCNSIFKNYSWAVQLLWKINTVFHRQNHKTFPDALESKDLFDAL
jgi:hypothetical protein